ncbi:MAG TPA: hypothetical protein ENJ97_00720, partial [Planctomycetes bacterium]|nr:hypothetical protein [Planctomycetota bacterium]
MFSFGAGACRTQTTWWGNPGGALPLNNIYRVPVAADVDGDGDLDLLAQGEYQGMPQVWFKLHQQVVVSGTWDMGK